MDYTPGSNELEPRLQRFCQLYVETCNAYQSARRAGYCNSVAKNTKTALFNRPGVIDYIRQLNQAIERPAIASIAEVQEFWTRIMRGEEDESYQTPDWRWKASETLAKAQGQFIERIQSIEQPDREINIHHTIVTKDINSVNESTVVESSVSDVL